LAYVFSFFFDFADWIGVYLLFSFVFSFVFAVCDYSYCLMSVLLIFYALLIKFIENFVKKCDLTLLKWFIDTKYLFIVS
jgi:hypothetical protein